METSPTVTIHGLGKLEASELKRLLDGNATVQESQGLGHTQIGDAAAFQLIAQATPWVAGIVGLWLLKPRKGKTTRRKLTRQDESGRLVEENIYAHEYVSDSPSEAVVSALSKLFGLTNEVVKKAIENATRKQGKT
jgi:hypothetical protein